MKHLKRLILAAAFVITMCLTQSAQATGPGASAVSADNPVFILAWSEYPSWSTFGVAHELGLINGDRGKYGTLEKEWKIDIVLRQADYDTCITMFGASNADFVCITNMDILSPSLSRRSTTILATSTSHGADALITTKDITSIKQLKGKNIRGLAKSVSEYVFARNCELQKLNYSDFNFRNMDPGAAAIAFQQRQDGIDAIVVWNPYVLETLNKRKDCHVLADSTTIPNEIVDMVVGANDSLAREGGKRAAQCIIAAFYAINQRLADSAQRDDTLIALGEKFANLTLRHMRKVVRQTRFYDTPAKAIALFESKNHREVMNRVVRFCQQVDMVKDAPIIAYGNAGSATDSNGKSVSNPHLLFDPSYMQSHVGK